MGPAINDFGFMLMMGLDLDLPTSSMRKVCKTYLSKSGEKQTKTQFMLYARCRINTIVAFPGLLANIYDQEVPMLRGVEHATAKTKKNQNNACKTSEKIFHRIGARRFLEESAVVIGQFF